LVVLLLGVVALEVLDYTFYFALLHCWGCAQGV
jgi:hypothetical protein